MLIYFIPIPLIGAIISGAFSISELGSFQQYNYFKKMYKISYDCNYYPLFESHNTTNSKNMKWFVEKYNNFLKDKNKLEQEIDLSLKKFSINYNENNGPNKDDVLFTYRNIKMYSEKIFNFRHSYEWEEFKKAHYMPVNFKMTSFQTAEYFDNLSKLNLSVKLDQTPWIISIIFFGTTTVFLLGMVFFNFYKKEKNSFFIEDKIKLKK